ncbi:phospho-N-acetylmuramoyl-pentapeptide-transferase [Erysipelothrix inopinata]|uniref:Phospho-N-acetylmuramoyl-pentapeptide-transferase n=1 Tax=Erysipelothrix inopinata TaxID=225084 RepID=A0A7G9RYB0_9FIRM|nr:phospho-N-acetylmuramoyl-pentapeptide-transferase [Erysipelothrix inopinata]QNN60585.1 phospho-N-acetylmuramoyl-pentapeptide-transferase [Erysipelothrix inopinata]
MVIGIVAMFVSFVVALVVYPKFIKALQKMDVKQQISEYALEEFKNKKKTPTFGGVIFVLVPILVAIIFNGFKMNAELFLLLFIYFAYALIGFVDDYKIVKEGKNDGISPRAKFLSQLVLAVVFYVIYQAIGGDNTIVIPFVDKPWDIGLLYLPFVMLVLSGTSNAVNLTDGMDGLAGGTALIAFVPFAYFAFADGNYGMFMFILTIIGSLIAYLVYNRKPAQIIMGDVGSLSLGAVLGSIAILLHKEILLVVVGGVFVFETLCVIIQRTSWKLRHKRVFRYTPIHYSFTLSGWKEKDVVNFFYILGLIFMVIGFALNALS